MQSKSTDGDYLDLSNGHNRIKFQNINFIILRKTRAYEIYPENAQSNTVIRMQPLPHTFRKSALK